MAKIRNQPPHRTTLLQRLVNLFSGAEHPSELDLAIPGFDARAHGDHTQADPSDGARLRSQLDMAKTRSERYNLADEMDKFDLITSFLDLYAEEATQTDYDKRKRFWIESKTPGLIEAGQECMDNCQLESDGYMLVRNMCKYGDWFTRLIGRTGVGVLSWSPIYDAMNVSRVDDSYRRLIGFKQKALKFRTSQSSDVSWPWDYVHFRLKGGTPPLDGREYGSSILYGMVRPWKQLVMAEDAVALARSRRVDRNLILVDVGDMDEVDSMEWVNMWRKALRKSEFVDPQSANYAKQYNPLTPIEDVIMPIREGDRTSVETMPGPSGGDNLFDVEHYISKLFATARVPKAFMGFEGDISARATLSNQSIRFARTIKRIQQDTVIGVRTLTDIHFTMKSTGNDLYAKAVQDPNSYIVQMAPASYLDEMDRLELLRLRGEITQAQAQMAQDLNIDPRVWSTYILLNYAKLPEELVLRLIAKTSTPQNANESANGSGYYQLSETEKKTIATMISETPAIRKVLGDLVLLHEDDWSRDVSAQLDMSRRLPMSSGVAPAKIHGIIMESDAVYAAHARDVQRLRAVPAAKQVNG